MQKACSIAGSRPLPSFVSAWRANFRGFSNCFAFCKVGTRNTSLDRFGFLDPPQKQKNDMELQGRQGERHFEQFVSDVFHTSSLPSGKEPSQRSPQFPKGPVLLHGRHLCLQFGLGRGLGAQIGRWLRQYDYEKHGDVIAYVECLEYVVI